MPLCSHCGAEYSPGVQTACRGCGLSPDPNTPPTLPAPPEEGGDEEVVFDVSAWPAEQRVGFSGTLRGEGVPFRWEAGPVLVVRTFDEAVVEGFLEDAGIDDEEWQDTTGIGDEEADDEAAHVAISDLFDAADRLAHNPTTGDVVDNVESLAGVIEESPPPFGIEPTAWKQMATMARAIVTAGGEGNSEAVEEAARHLRDYLRDFV